MLDFGCGAGVLFPALLSLGSQVYACDLDLSAARELAREHSWTNVVWIDGARELEALEPGVFDAVIALDVLEHVDSSKTRSLAALFSRLLSDSGRLLLSGPTESWIYRLGRRVSGFRGDYHVQTIYDIESTLIEFFDLRLETRLYWPFTLFRILSGTPRSSGQSG